jgi:hypothetical protein
VLSKYAATSSQLVKCLSTILHWHLIFEVFSLIIIWDSYTYLFFLKQTLQKEFGDYVRSTQEHSVMLCNQHIEVIPSLILLRVPPKSTAKFGSGWKDFCRRNGYQEGDKIRFKFAGPLRHNLIHVRKI